MKDLFPKMRECPEGKHIALGGLYWVVYQIMLPYILSLFISGLAESHAVVIGCCAAFCIINLVCVCVIFRSYLQESFWVLRMDVKKVFVTIGMGLAALTVLEIPFVLLDLILKRWLVFFTLPAADPMFYLKASRWFLMYPVSTGVCMAVLTPVTMCCLYYAVGFAVPAQERPWLGYLIVALIAVVPAALMYTSGVYDLADAAVYYVSMLPFHICACWVYQRSDTIWGPIIFQILVNLLSSPIAWMLSHVTYTYTAFNG